MAELASEIDNVIGVKQANDDELGADRRARRARRKRRNLPTVPGARRDRRHPRRSHLVGPEMRALYDAATSGGLDRAREIDESLAADLRGHRRDLEPDPGQDGARDARASIEDDMRLPMVPASHDERAAVRAALEQHGLLVAGGAG